MFKPTVDSLISDINAKVAKLLQVKASEEAAADKARADAIASNIRADQHRDEASRASRIAEKLESLLS